MADQLLLLDIADRFGIDPDRARDLDASVLGLLAADRARN